VLNTDTIRVLADAVAVRLGGGSFAPGMMPEAEGAPEIEIEVRGETSAGLSARLRLMSSTGVSDVITPVLT
jgi:hypothetical protein